VSSQLSDVLTALYSAIDRYESVVLTALERNDVGELESLLRTQGMLREQPSLSESAPIFIEARTTVWRAQSGSMRWERTTWHDDIIVGHEAGIRTTMGSWIREAEGHAFEEVDGQYDVGVAVLVDPAPILGFMRIDSIEESAMLGRPTYHVRGRPSHSPIPHALSLGPGVVDRYVFDVDRERGVLLSLILKARGVELQAMLTEEVSFDAPLPGDTFTPPT
jgi:hypothetical protein